MWSVGVNRLSCIDCSNHVPTYLPVSTALLLVVHPTAFPIHMTYLKTKMYCFFIFHLCCTDTLKIPAFLIYVLTCWVFFISKIVLLSIGLCLFMFAIPSTSVPVDSSADNYTPFWLGILVSLAGKKICLSVFDKVGRWIRNFLLRNSIEG